MFRPFNPSILKNILMNIRSKYNSEFMLMALRIKRK